MREIKVTPVFEENWQALTVRRDRYICNEGSTRSSKTFSIVQVLIIYCKNNANTEVTICSHSLPHLKRGAYKDFMTIMNAWSLYDENSHNKTDHIYHFDNGSYIEFFGLEDPDKAKGPGRGILFINEANLINKSVFDQLNMRTRWKVFTDLNPADFDCWCYKIADGPNAIKIVSTFQNNITNLSQEQIDAIYAYQDADPNMWKVFGLGQRGTSIEQIYTHWKIIDRLPNSGDTFYGLDFGFNVPSALTEIRHYDGGNYWKERIYKKKLTTPELISELHECNIGYDLIYCDAAEPDRILEIQRAGFNAKPADKDVLAGIRKVKSMPLYVTADSENLIKELGSYKWKTDKDGNILDEPIKANDHGIDGGRYGVYTHLIKPKLSWVAF